MKRALTAISSALTLSGCITPQTQAGPPVTLEDLVRQLKKDIGEYNSYAKLHADDPRLKNVCGGKVNLKITSATVSVTTSAKSENSASAGAEVSPAAFLSKVGLAGGFGRTTENSQVLTFTVEPAPDKDQPATSGTLPERPGQLFFVLTNLRESLLRSSDTAPCLRFPEKQDNSVEFGFAATRSTTAGIAVNLLIFSLGASHGRETSVANSIKIAFEGGKTDTFIFTPG